MLQEVAVFLELKGENSFRVKTNFNAVRSVEIIEEDFEEMIRQCCLKDMKGISATLA